MRDLRYALRSLVNARGFALAVILTLGLGIGANTAIFSVVRGVLLRPLPHKNGDRLIYLRQSAQGPGAENVLFSVPEINDFRESSKSIGQGIAEYSPISFTLIGEKDAIRIDAGLVTGNYLSVMGLAPILGRPFNAGDDGKGASPVMILTYDFWNKRFGGDPSVVGRKLQVNGKAVEVVGVLQQAPYFPGRIDALMNMVISEHHVSATMVTGRTHRMTEVVARLAPGATIEQARAEVAGISTRVHAQYPEAYDAGSKFQVTLTPFQEVMGQKAKLTLWLLMGAAGFVLIIACANVANLTLIRGVRREHELVVRAALGAGTKRLRRLLLAENLILALLGSVVGLVLAFGGVRMLITFAARYSPRADEIRVDGMVLGFTLALAVVVAILLSYAPTLANEMTLGASLAGGGRRSTGGIKRQRLQQSLVVAQVAVSVILLTGAGLLTRTMQRLAVVDTGLVFDNVLTMQVEHDFSDTNTTKAYADYEEMARQISALPGVTQVGFGSTIPLRRAGFMLDIKAENRPTSPGEAMPTSEYRTANPEYFRASGIPLVRGRLFTSSDRAGGPRVAILNKALADRLFPNQDPLGKRVAWTGEVLKFIPVSGDWRTVVGVVGNTKDGGLDAETLPVMFMPASQEPFPASGLIIHAKTDPSLLASSATRVVRGIAPRLPIEHVMTMGQIKDESVAPRRLNAMLVASFGVLAMLVAAVGIAGVLAFSVSARTNEIGIRMSLGADALAVQRMIISEGGLLVVIGLVIGAVGALSLSQMIRGLLFGVAPHDPITILFVTAVMSTVGVLACWIPAARAARIDPATALRAQ